MAVTEAQVRAAFQVVSQASSVEQANELLGSELAPLFNQGASGEGFSEFESPAGDPIQIGLAFPKVTFETSVSGVAAGVYGNDSQIPVVTVDKYGRVTHVDLVSVGSGGASGPASGDLSGTYPAPTVSGLSGHALPVLGATSGGLRWTGASWVVDSTSYAPYLHSHDYLPIANPTYTGLLTGPRATLTEFGKFQSLVGDTAVAAIYGTGVTPSTTNYALRFNDSGTGTILNASTAVSLAIGATSKVYVTTDAVDLGSGVALKMSATTVIDASRNGTFKSLASEENVFLPYSIIWKSGAANYFSLYATSLEFGLRDLADGGSIVSYPLVVKRGVGGEVQIGYSGGLRPVRIGGSLKNDALAGAGARALVALADGTIDDQDASAFRGTIGALASSLKGSANGVAELDATGRVPSWQLPSYVDDVVEVTNFAALPGTGESGKIYITLDENKTWRWSGSGYAEISASLALGGTASTAHRGDHGVIAYAHSQVFSGNPHGTTPDDIGAFAKVFVGGGIDFHGFATPGVYEIRGNSWANGWAGLTGTQGVALLQMHDADGLRFLVAGDTKYGGLMLKFQASEIPGDHWSPWFTVWDSGSLPASTVGKSVLAATDAAAARTAIGAAGLPSKADVTTSRNLGDISASVVKVTAPGVTLTLAGGYNAQGWDIVNPVDAVDFAIPAGVTLFRNGGASLGPGTYSPGSGKALRIVRADASTWIMPNLV